MNSTLNIIKQNSIIEYSFNQLCALFSTIYKNNKTGIYTLGYDNIDNVETNNSIVEYEDTLNGILQGYLIDNIAVMN